MAHSGGTGDGRSTGAGVVGFGDCGGSGGLAFVVVVVDGNVVARRGGSDSANRGSSDIVVAVAAVVVVVAVAVTVIAAETSNGLLLRAANSRPSDWRWRRCCYCCRDLQNNRPVLDGLFSCAGPAHGVVPERRQRLSRRKRLLLLVVVLLMGVVIMVKAMVVMLMVMVVMKMMMLKRMRTIRVLLLLLILSKSRDIVLLFLRVSSTARGEAGHVKQHAKAIFLDCCWLADRLLTESTPQLWQGLHDSRERGWGLLVLLSMLQRIAFVFKNKFPAKLIGGVLESKISNA